ncbi:MAG: polyprenyl synthetase family protein [Cytophagaceae bacterium]|nr:polyprenyl synthetase family protein [Cytophagaceae bacterium]
MQANVQKILKNINDEIKSHKFGKNPPELYEPIDYMMGLGGKRMRPLLTLLSANLFSDNIEAFIKPSVAVEVFHNFTLMHDDIMDNAPLRRGQTTVHEKWNKNTAILSGDVMLVKAYELFVGLNENTLKETIIAFNDCAVKVCEGQQLDINFEAIDAVTEENYLEMITLKTAALLGFSAELGGILGETDSQNRTYLREFGINMGIGFQLMDDLLDVYGDADKFGKVVGGDILAKKKTFLLIKAREKASRDDLNRLNNALESDIEPALKISAVTEIYNRLNIKEETENKMNWYFDEAFKKLSKVDAPLYKKTIIKDFTKKLLTREK